MAVSLTVKRKFIVNGKEYGSIDELPETIRKALGRQISTNSNKKTYSNTTKTKIVFNNQEYANMDAMPQNIRETYQQALQAAGLSAAEKTPNEVADLSKAFQVQKAIVPLSGSFRALWIWILLGGLIIILYFILSFLR
jgi:hypothetical protein